MTGADLQADAWVAANEIGEKRGYEVNFGDERDQELVLSKVFTRARRQRDWKLRSSVSIDAEYEGNLSWAERIEEKVSTDPLAILLNREVAAEEAAELAASYSQAKAYLVVLTNFNHDRHRLCSYLVISSTTLQQRMSRATEIALRQPSLFNGRERIDENFVPLAGRPAAALVKFSREALQGELQL